MDFYKLKKYALIIAVAMTCFTSNAYSASHWHTSKIKSIYPLAAGGLVLIFDIDSANCPATNTGKYHYIKVGGNGVTQVGIQNILSLSMLAATTDKSMSINFSDASTQCYINRVKVNF